MKRCPRCGFHHSSLDERCLRCGTVLEGADDGPDPLSPQRHEKPENSRLLRQGRQKRGGGFAARDFFARLAAFLRRRLFFLRERLRSPLPAGIHYRNPWLAGALSLVPGLGQLYNHQLKKAGLMLALVALAFALAALTFYHPLSNLFLLGYLLAALYAFHDALVTAKQINGDILPWQHAAGFYLAWIFYVAALSLGVQYAASDFCMKLRHIPFDDMAPVFRRGERIVIDSFTPRRRLPRVGDVVYYDPPGITMENPQGLAGFNDNAVYGSVISVNPSSAIERVVAGPGQTFERREGVFYRDGHPVPVSEQPLVQDQIPMNFKLKAPAEGYLVLFSYAGSWVDPAAPLEARLANSRPEGSVFTEQPPRLNAPGWIMRDWEKGCVVKREAITGIVRWVYQPPAARRIVR